MTLCGLKFNKSRKSKPRGLLFLSSACPCIMLIKNTGLLEKKTIKNTNWTYYLELAEFDRYQQNCLQ